MKKKVVFVIYRKWAFEIVKQIFEFKKNHDFFEVPAIIITPNREFDLQEAEKLTKTYVIEGRDNVGIHQVLKQAKADAVFFYGWSWMVNKEIADSLLCMVHHPSPLPKYRGGTPIQNQIVRREKISAVTVFRMTGGIDNGDIYMQLPMSLSGDINNIFARMINLGVKITKQFLQDLKKGTLKFTPQKNPDNYPPFKKRKPKDSKIPLDKLNQTNYIDVYNLVRGLLDPLPNAYIMLGSQKLLIQKVQKIKTSPPRSLIISNSNQDHGAALGLQHKTIVLKLNDGYAKIAKHKLE